ncbi:Pollen Ole e 1 allergen and extensin family protein [Quillaja saponaria]|uniref:Pollen Ole e 1 allergen and extensin family protein n=1 Tax=Quillaja saponaria TaxID=32244 RepID=A0AAD7PZK5_QUISA|nr:Pollen Ole e 1 allergen and extensin family protein [Quillaja saponaria]
MAYRFMLLLAFLFVVTTSLAHGSFIINETTIAQVVIPGRAFCSINGNPVNSNTPGLAGVNVQLVCNGATTLTQVLTDSQGFFRIVLNTLDGILFDPSKCVIRIRLPIASCSVLAPTSGNLQSVITLAGVVQSVLGAVANFTSGLFVLVPN